MVTSFQTGNAVANDYDAMPVGDFSSRSRTGSSETKHRDGHMIVSSSKRSCPHRWIDNREPVDLGRARSKPYEEWL
jgi:hypothetical protein